jgi:hypothetical protein
MVMPRVSGVHAGGTAAARRPAYPQGAVAWAIEPARCPWTPAAASELGNQLRPDRNRPDEQRDRCQRRGFFHECLQHGDLLYWNIRRTLFLFCSRSQEAVVGQFEE